MKVDSELAVISRPLSQPLTESIRTNLAGKRMLVTGGSGYLATNLIGLLTGIECQVLRVSRSEGKLVSLAAGIARIDDVSGNLHDQDFWKQALIGVDVVFHLAAQTSVYVAETDPLSDLKSNVVPLLHLLETCRKNSYRPTIVFAGTVTEAGIPERLPVDETHSDHPVTVYDHHKLMAENYLKHYVTGGHIVGTSLRLANVYGPGPRSSSGDRGILNMMMRRALNCEPLTIYGTGENLRDYVFVDDVARAFLAAAVSIEKLNGKHFVIGSGQGHTIAEAMKLVAERAALRVGRKADVVHVDPPDALSPIEARNFVANSTTFTEATGWRAEVTLIDGIDRTLDTLL